MTDFQNEVKYHFYSHDYVSIKTIVVYLFDFVFPVRMCFFIIIKFYNKDHLQ